MRKLGILLAIMLILTSFSPVFGESNKSFSDIGEDHWAYESIMKMSERGIINGFEDGTFRPDAQITRAQFAKMMIRTLNLNTSKPSKASFEDVAKNHWAYGYVEGSKFYMTGYIISDKNYFKPDDPSVREDLAVALVKALGHSATENSLTVLRNFEDQDEISPNLKSYMAKAVEIGLFTGEEMDGKKYLNPMSPISRAETATLLARLIKDTENGEKVTYDDEEKVTYDDKKDKEEYNPSSRTPKLEVSKYNDEKAKLEWSKVSSDGFKYYKVVLSKKDSTPVYPENGYAQSISNVKSNSTYVKLGNKYNNGDFGDYIKEGTYYISITAVYKDGSYPSNVRLVTFDGEVEDKYNKDEDKYNNNVDAKTPELKIIEEDDDEVEIKWSPVSSDNFTYYKIVISKENSSPKYPDDGYMTYISNPNETEYEIELYKKYNGGDFGGKLLPGKYYVSITAVFKDGKYTSNTVRINLEED